MKYQITGADKETGEDIVMTVEAASFETAEANARRRGVLISDTVLLSGDAPAKKNDEALPASVQSSDPVSIASDNHISLQRILLLVAAGLGVLATFMPWVKGPLIGSIAGSAGDGWFTFALFGGSFAMVIWLGDRKNIIYSKQRIYALAPAVIAGLLGLWKIIDFQSSMSESRLDDNPFVSGLALSFDIGFGLYLVVACAIAFPIISFTVKR